MKLFVAGGTSGMGLALASSYLEQGYKVAICGRNLHKNNPEVYTSMKTYQLDIYNKNALKEAVTDFAGDELDMMIISAGAYSDDSLSKLNYEESAEMLKVNIAGVVNALEVAREAMYKQQKGHIIVFASVSGFLHYKEATLYSKTKRALIQISDAYRKTLVNFGIRITVVAPGYVDTPKLRELNDNDLSKKPFVINCEEATKIIMQGITENKELIIFPSRMKNLIRVLSCLPSWLLTMIMRKKAKRMNQK